MTYRATPVTQRDGSALQNSNCRMAAIATGLDYDTLGAKKSSGAKMRSFTDDQSGGTDSADAVQSWSRGYSESLRVMDGSSWDQAVADLKAGRLVHLDVWAAAVGSAGMCLSGSGAYGHTIAVAPEASGSRWLVADPWCDPPKWQWCEAAALQHGAETWAGQVKAAQTQGPLKPRAHVTRELLSRWTPEHPRQEPADPPETGGGGIYFTTTGTHVGGSTVKFVNVSGTNLETGRRINVGPSTRWGYFDGTDGGDIPGEGAQIWVGKADSNTGRHIIRIKVPQPYADKIARDTDVLLISTNEPYDINIPPEPPGPTYSEGWNDANTAMKADVDRVLPKK